MQADEALIHISGGTHTSVPVGDGHIRYFGVFLPREVVDKIVRVAEKQKISVPALLTQMIDFFDGEKT